MAQVRDTCFRVLQVNDIDIDIVDFHKEMPVTVELDHEKYNASLQQDIQSLEAGYAIEAQLQSQDILQIDGIWRFVDLSIFERSKITYQESIDIPNEKAQEYNYRIASKGGVFERFDSPENLETSVAMIVDTYDKDEWTRLRYMDPHKDVYGMLPSNASPPFEIIHQQDINHGLIRSYFISETDSEFSDSIRQSANS
jgi:hypothetical protein